MTTKINLFQFNFVPKGATVKIQGIISKVQKIFKDGYVALEGFKGRFRIALHRITGKDGSTEYQIQFLKRNQVLGVML